MAKILPKPGTYKARRTAPIVIQESPNGALMAYIAYSLTDSAVAYSGVHSLVLGKIDGSLMLKAFENLHKIFPAWETNNPFDLASVEIPEGNGAEFELADCYIDDTYVPANSTDGSPVLQFKAQWLNSLGGSTRLPDVTPDEVESITSKWSVKWDAIGSLVKPAAPAPAKAEKKVKVAKEPANPTPASGETSTPKSAGLPKRGAPKKARESSAEQVMELLVKKHHPKGANDDDMQELGDKYFYPAQDELFGVNVSAETPEQWGQVADKLGL